MPPLYYIYVVGGEAEGKPPMSRARGKESSDERDEVVVVELPITARQAARRAGVGRGVTCEEPVDENNEVVVVEQTVRSRGAAGASEVGGACVRTLEAAQVDRRGGTDPGVDATRVVDKPRGSVEIERVGAGLVVVSGVERRRH